MVLVMIGAGGSELEAGAIEGRVTLPPPRPGPVVNRRNEIVNFGGVHKTNPPTAVVYLEGKFPAPTGPLTARMEQKDQTFVPALLPVRVGTRVEFPNLDRNHHELFSFSRAKTFVFGRISADERPQPSVVFDEAGLIKVRCEIHEHMQALILVLDTPHFVVTKADGSYRLPDLPAGEYLLKVWMDSETTLERRVVVSADGSQRQDFP